MFQHTQCSAVGSGSISQREYFLLPHGLAALLQVQQPDLNFTVWKGVGTRGATSGVSHHVWGDIPISQQTSPYSYPSVWSGPPPHSALLAHSCFFSSAPGKPLELCTEGTGKAVCKVIHPSPATQFKPPLSFHLVKTLKVSWHVPDCSTTVCRPGFTQNQVQHPE